MADYILDTNAFITLQAGQITPQAREIIESPENKIWLSLASIWEMAIKAGNGKLPAFAAVLAGGAVAVDQLLRESGIDLIPIELAHTVEAAALPQHHRDPFDRMILAQARLEHLTVVTRDRIFARYGVQVLPA